jgi:hypothetical protein
MIFSRKIFIAITPITSPDRNPKNSSGGLAALDLLWQILTAMPRQLTAKNRQSYRLVASIT